MSSRFLAVLFAVSLLSLLRLAQADVAGHLRVSTGGAAQWPDLAASAKRQNYVILHAWEIDRLRSLKLANPALRVLLYKNLSAINSFGRQDGYQSTGVAMDEVDPDHPDWFLKNTSGERFHFSGYDWLWAADIGNPGFQKRWGDNVAGELRAAPWDGVFIDDVNPTIRYHYGVTDVAKYPSDAAYQAATRSALAAINPTLKATGKTIFANMGSSVGYNPVVSDWLQFVDGAMDETFTKWSDQPGANYRDTTEWERQLGEVKELESRGKVFLGVTQSALTDRAAARYGFASMLLGAAGRAAFQMGSDYERENWFPEYDYSFGAPVGGETRDAQGLHRRAFTTGLVVVNPTTTSRVVSFGGRYSGSGLTNATSTTLAPHSGLILTRQATAAASGLSVSTLSLVAAPAPAAGVQAQTPPASRSGGVLASHVRVRVRCVRVAGGPCRGRIVLRARATGARSLGRRNVAIARGRSAILRVSLNPVGRRLARSAGVNRIRAAAAGAPRALPSRRSLMLGQAR